MDVVGFLHGSDKRKEKRRHEGYRFCVGKCVHGLWTVDRNSRARGGRSGAVVAARGRDSKAKAKARNKQKGQTG